MRITFDLGHGGIGCDWADRISEAAMNGVRIATHVSRGWYSDRDLTVKHSTDLLNYFVQLRRCGVHNSPLGLDTFDTDFAPPAAIFISVQATRAEQVLAEVDFATRPARLDAKNAGNLGLRLALAETGLLTPTIIWARARQLLELEDAVGLFDIAA